MVSLNRSADYAYLYPRIMASKSCLLGHDDIRSLAALKNVEEYVAFLERTRYRGDIKKTGELGKQGIEFTLQGNLIDISRLIMDCAPERARPLFESLMLKYEIDLIKSILNRLEGGGGVEKSDLEYSTYHPILSSEIRESFKVLNLVKTKKEAIDILDRTRYWFLSDIPDAEMTSENISSLLDRYYFQEIWGSIEGLPSEDAEYARRLIGTEIELINILTLFRSAVHGYRAERFIIPINYGIANIVNALVGMDLQGVVSALSGTQYGGIVSDGFRYYGEDKSLLRLELEIKRYLLGEHRRVFSGYPFHVGVLLGFLKLKEYEIKNLISILVGIEYDLPVDERESLLVC